MTTYTDHPIPSFTAVAPLPHIDSIKYRFEHQYAYGLSKHDDGLNNAFYYPIIALFEHYMFSMEREHYFYLLRAVFRPN